MQTITFHSSNTQIDKQISGKVCKIGDIEVIRGISYVIKEVFWKSLNDCWVRVVATD